MERNTHGGNLPWPEDETPSRSDLRKSLDPLRVEAAQRLARIADESGVDSRLYAMCSELWRQREENASDSLTNGDGANALLILRRALELIALAPAILSRNELCLSDLESLLRAA